MKHYKDVEMQIINSALMSEEKFFKLVETPVDVFTGPNRSVITAIHDLYNDNGYADLPALVIQLKNMNVNFDVDEYISKLINSHVLILDFDNSIAMLREQYRQRMVQVGAADVYKSVDLGDDYKQKIFELNELLQEEEKNSAFDLKNFELDYYDREQFYVKSGIPDLDKKIVGFMNGQVNIIAARPGLGKTSLALQIAKDKKSLFCSFEMPREELYAKLLSNQARVQVAKIFQNKMSDTERARVMKSHLELKERLDMRVIDSADSFVDFMTSLSMQIKIFKPEIVFIDYVQLISGAPGANQNERISNISRAIKKLAMRSKLPFVVLSQLSREVEKQNREPILSDLRDSGSLEQDATIVIFLHEKENVFYPIVAKGRFTQCGKIESIQFVKEFGLFKQRTDHEINIKGMDYIHD